jgi:hypothetical protein
MHGSYGRRGMRGDRTSRTTVLGHTLPRVLGADIKASPETESDTISSRPWPGLLANIPQDRVRVCEIPHTGALGRPETFRLEPRANA